MIIKTERQQFDCMVCILLNYFPLLQKTLLNNIANCNKISSDYLNTRVMISIVEELEYFFQKKQFTKAKKFKLEFTEAEGIYLFKIIMDLPINRENIYTDRVRNQWLEQLNQQIIYTLPYEKE
ncbi:MAG: hypothetical protein H7320_11570 [Ferruginibacter sp.]|nr:hypothetical protein [Ferruginibacter sp.]